jgi:probable phosphoglycerate mutase
MRLLLVRHGETEYNRRQLTLGRADLPLNGNGRRQAQQIASALSGEPLAAVYASPLRRTIETATPIAEVHELTVQINPGLIEMDIGELEGLTFNDMRERYPDLLKAWVGGPEGPKVAMPGGERLLDVQTRATEALRSIAGAHAEGTVCAVSHNFVILSLLAEVLAIDLAGFRRLRHAVGAITTLEVNGDRARLIHLNDTCHLTSAVQL